MEPFNPDPSQSQFSVTSSEMSCAFPAPSSLLPQVKLKRFRMPKINVKSSVRKKFTEEQRKILKEAYKTNYWPSSEFYEDLALTANLTLQQVKVRVNKYQFRIALKMPLQN